MKSTDNFGDQVVIVNSWFSSWSECEQVVTLYSLLRKIGSRQVKFIGQVIGHMQQGCTDLDQQEQQANDPG